jgi:hypothetical protein
VIRAARQEACVSPFFNPPVSDETRRRYGAWRTFVEEHSDPDWERGERLTGWTRAESEARAAHGAVRGLICLLQTRGQFKGNIDESSYWFADFMATYMEDLDPQFPYRMTEILRECLNTGEAVNSPLSGQS